jgi:transglutaminase-like putative cysteine protease
MRNLARQGSVDSLVRQTAVSLTSQLRQKDWNGEIAALHAFVRDKVRYVRDVMNVETLQTANRTLLNRAGDCDDKSVLLASLLLAIGHPARFVAVGFRNPNSCEHVFVETRADNRGGAWIGLETTEPVPPGWSPLQSGKQTKTIVMEI